MANELNSFGDILGSSIKGIELNYEDGQKVEFCTKCGQATRICKEILSKKVIVPVGCKCRQQELREREKLKDFNDRQDILTKYFSGSKDSVVYSKSTFKNWDDKLVPMDIKLKCMHYAEKFDLYRDSNTGIMMFGNTGRGKTYASSCIMNYIKENHKYTTVLMLQLPRLIELATSFYYSEKIGETEIYKKLRYADLLIIDDFGVEKNDIEDRIYKIINERILQQKPIIISTNLSEKDLNKYHARVWSRLFELASLRIEFSGTDIRGKNRNNKVNFINGITNLFKGRE